MPLRIMTCICFALSLTVLIGLRIEGNMAHARSPEDDEARTEPLKWPRSLVVDFLGLQDKPVARLVLYPHESKVAVEDRFQCGRQATCAEFAEESFARLTSRLAVEFFKTGKNDADAKNSGGFRFSLTESPGVTKILELNRDHSAKLLDFAAQSLPEGKARDELSRRLAIVSR